MMKKLALGLIVLFIAGCSQWNVVELRPRQYSFIENGSGPGKVVVPVDDYGMERLTVSLSIINDRICVADNTMKRIQVMDSDGDVDLVIGSLADIDKKKVKAVQFNFNVIGNITMDSDGNLFVQNRLTQGKGDASGEEGELTPSYILSFNEKGDLQYTLGQKGTPDTPFYNIEAMEVDNEGRLFVITRQNEAWSVYRYTGKKRDYHANLATLHFMEKEGDDKYQGKIENVMVFDDGEMLLISVAYYQDWRLAYRKLYEYSMPKGTLEKMLMNIPDPRNVLFSIVNDRLVNFWNIDNNEVRFMYCNLEGSIMKNVLLNINLKTNYYTRLIGDRRGNLFSYSIIKKGVLIQQWE